MQRGLDAETKQQLEEDHKRIISDEHWYLDLPELKARESVTCSPGSPAPVGLELTTCFMPPPL